MINPEEFLKSLHKEEEKIRILREALEEIAQGQGAFSLDRLTHAFNCIEHAKEVARAALEQTK
jgi:hypothetical protein